MKRILIDTNCLLSFLTDRNETQQEQIRPFFQRATNAEFELVILTPIKLELVYVLDKVYKIKKHQIRSILLDLFATPGIKFSNTGEDQAELGFWPEKIPDFADALLAQYARTGKFVTVKSPHRRLYRHLC